MKINIKQIKIDYTVDSLYMIESIIYNYIYSGNYNFKLNLLDIENINDQFYIEYEKKLNNLHKLFEMYYRFNKITINFDFSNKNIEDYVMNKEVFPMCKNCPCFDCDLPQTNIVPDMNVPIFLFCKKSFLELNFKNKNNKIKNVSNFFEKEMDAEEWFIVNMVRGVE